MHYQAELGNESSLASPTTYDEMARDGMAALQASPNPPAYPGLRFAPTWAEQLPALQAYFRNSLPPLVYCFFYIQKAGVE
jgi:hypothetical protein